MFSKRTKRKIKQRLCTGYISWYWATICGWSFRWCDHQLTYSTVEPLHNGHLGAEESGRGGLNNSHCMDCSPKTVAVSGGSAVLKKKVQWTIATPRHFFNKQQSFRKTKKRQVTQQPSVAGVANGAIVIWYNTKVLKIHWTIASSRRFCLH